MCLRRGSSCSFSHIALDVPSFPVTHSLLSLFSKGSAAHHEVSSSGLSTASFSSSEVQERSRPSSSTEVGNLPSLQADKHLRWISTGFEVGAIIDQCLVLLCSRILQNPNPTADSAMTSGPTPLYLPRIWPRRNEDATWTDCRSSI